MSLLEEELTQAIIGAAIEVHRELGPGLLESIYESCLCREFEVRNILFERQKAIEILYKGEKIEGDFRLDLVVENKVIVELKCAESLLPVHQAQLLTYLKITGIKIGLLINFNSAVLKHGIKRMVL